MANQQTIAKSFTLTGVGLHSNKWVDVVFHPAPPDSGILFRRVDVSPHEIIQAKAQNVVNTQRCTEIANANGCAVAMVEHVLSALRGIDVDNVIIDVSGEEIPILDGSALAIASHIREIGLAQQDITRKVFRLRRTVRVEDGNALLEAVPSDNLSYAIEFKNDHNLSFLCDHTAFFDVRDHDYLKEIAPARTFGYEKEVEFLRSIGLIKGASLDNAVLIGEEAVISNLRFPDEFARHKLLDVIGDLALVPPFVARIRGERTSHKLNNLFAREIINHLIGD